jgi:hypothetical protein
MTIKSLSGTLSAELSRVTTWINAALIAALPFSSEIMDAVNANLPSLAPYLPENIYKAVGLAAVLFNMAASIKRAHRQQ